MKVQLLAVFDRAMNAYGDPIPCHTVAAGVRGFQDAVNDPKSPMNRHPEDYDLFHIAEYDTHQASFTTTMNTDPNSAAGAHHDLMPYMVARAKDLIEHTSS